MASVPQHNALLQFTHLRQDALTHILRQDGRERRGLAQFLRTPGAAENLAPCALLISKIAQPS
jgi:hypothetical protein